MTALYNPILGDIPQPKNNSNEVAFNLLPSSNYKAQVTTPLVNTLFIKTFTESGSGTNSYNTERDIVITQIVVQGYCNFDTGDSGTIDIYLNNEVIKSLDFASQTDNIVIPFFLNIPLEHCLLMTNTLLRMVVVTNGGMATNCSFIGYEYTKQ